jgi:hypothetical protein
LQNLSRILHELAALRGQFQHTALSARQQRLANLGFEFRDLLANRRLGAADGFRRARKAHGVSDDQKRAQAVDIEIH